MTSCTERLETEDCHTAREAQAARTTTTNIAGDAQPSSLVVTSSTRADMGASHLCGVVCRVLTGMARYAPTLLPHPSVAMIVVFDAPYHSQLSAFSSLHSLLHTYAPHAHTPQERTSRSIPARADLCPTADGATVAARHGAGAVEKGIQMQLDAWPTAPPPTASTAAQALTYQHSQPLLGTFPTHPT